MIEWLLTSLLGGSMRSIEALLAATPTLLVGLLVAAILRFYLGTSGTQRLFGGETMRSLPQSWAVGMLLPVCSIGVLPILIEMRRARVKAGAMSAFALSAPLFNPLSLLYGLTLSRPYVILMFAAGSLIVVSIVGIVWDCVASRRVTSDPESSAGSSDVIGVRRLAAMLVYVCRQLFGPIGVWAFVACLGAGFLATVLPWGSLGHSMGRDDWWAPARMAWVAIAAYATPMLAMSQLGMMFQHANSPGAAFILLVIGAGVNFGTLAWMARQFGIREVVVWFGSLMIVVTAIAYAINRPLIPPGVNPSGHTHAFDVYTNPIHHLDSNFGSFARQKLGEKFGLVEQIGLTFLSLLCLLGAVFRFAGISDESLAAGQLPVNDREHTHPPNEQLAFDRVVGPQVVGGTLIAGLVAVSIVMCYGFYPSPEECIKEIKFVRADVLSAALSGDAEHAKAWIPQWDEWSRRMEVGSFLRVGRLTPYQRMQGFLLRKKLDLLEHELEHDHLDTAFMRELVADLMSTDKRLLTAFRKPYDGSNASAERSERLIRPDEDVRHKHTHSHDSFQTHDHEHEDFSGTHDHDHDHVHRHSDPPHGGVLISLDHHRHIEGTSNPHLEVMPPMDGELVVYPLRELLGVLRSVKTRPGRLMVRHTGDAPSKNPEVFELKWDSDKKRYQGRPPKGIDATDHSRFIGELTLADDTSFDFSFPSIEHR